MITKKITPSVYGVLGAGVLALALGLNFSVVQAALTAGQDIIPAPASVADDTPGAENDAQQAFDEAQNVVLPRDIRCDDGVTLAAGTRVNSHMIFLNTEGTTLAEDEDVTWTFDGDVLCVMSDAGGALEAATNDILGAPGTFYPGGFPARGLEGNDAYSVSGNEITVTMRVTEPGDWIRVVTAWTDTEAPEVACVETVNPHGKNKPQAPGNGGQGQNQDGFYELLARDNEEGVQLFVTDSETGTVFGPFAPGTKMKYVEANGATPKSTAMGGNNGNGGNATAVDVMIKGQGDAYVTAVDAAGNVSPRAACLVPNPPK